MLQVGLVVVPNISKRGVAIALNNLLSLNLEQHSLLGREYRVKGRLEQSNCVQDVDHVYLFVVARLCIFDQSIESPLFFSGAFPATDKSESPAVEAVLEHLIIVNAVVERCSVSLEVC